MGFKYYEQNQLMIPMEWKTLIDKDKEIKILCTNSTTICHSICECFGDIVVEINDNNIVKDYEKKSYNLIALRILYEKNN